MGILQVLRSKVQDFGSFELSPMLNNIRHYLSCIFKTCAQSYPFELETDVLDRVFIYFSTLCVQPVKALARVSSEPSQLAFVICVHYSLPMSLVKFGEH